MNNDNYKEKKITTSKLIVFITFLLFALTLSITFFMYISGKIENVTDVSVLGICVTVTGSIFGSNICWYSKKATAENHYKLRMSLYKDSANVRYKYNVDMFKAMKELGMTEHDLEMIENNSDSDEMMTDALTSVSSKLNENEEDASSMDEIETIS